MPTETMDRTCLWRGTIIQYS